MPEAMMTTAKAAGKLFKELRDEGFDRDVAQDIAREACLASVHEYGIGVKSDD